MHRRRSESRDRVDYKRIFISPFFRETKRNNLDCYYLQFSFNYYKKNINIYIYIYYIRDRCGRNNWINRDGDKYKSISLAIIFFSNNYSIVIICKTQNLRFKVFTACLIKI